MLFCEASLISSILEKYIPNEESSVDYKLAFKPRIRAVKLQVLNLGHRIKILTPLYSK